MVKTRITGRASPVYWGVGIGAFLSISMTVIYAAVVASLVLGGYASPEIVGHSGLVAIPLSVFAGGLVAHGMTKRRRALVCMMVAGAYYCVWFGTATAFFGGMHGGGVTMAVMTLAGAVVATMTGLKGKGHRRFTRGKYRSR